MQKNAFRYMQERYRYWEMRKYDIFNWLEKEVRINPKFLEKTYKEKCIIGKKYLYNKFILLTLDEGGVYRLFGKIKISKKMIHILKN